VHQKTGKQVERLELGMHLAEFLFEIVRHQRAVLVKDDEIAARTERIVRGGDQCRPVGLEQDEETLVAAARAVAAGPRSGKWAYPAYGGEPTITAPKQACIP
jgi:hypothetical protein